MNLKEYAENELRLAGLFDKDSDYNGMVGPAVMRMIEVFSAERHSGFSANLCLSIFDRVSRYKQLTPLTYAKDEWDDVSEMSGEKLWQNKRNPSVFSKDEGLTHYDLDEAQKGGQDAKV